MRDSLGSRGCASHRRSRIDGGINIPEEELRYQLDRKDHHPLAGDERLLDVLADLEERGLIRSMLYFALTDRGYAVLPAD